MVESAVDNPYAVLGVSSTATQEEIQAAYKRKARELHPDVNRQPDAEARFKRLVAAYDVLRDENKRARWDAFGKKSPRKSRSVRYEDVRVGTDDLRRSWHRREIELRIELSEAFTGTSTTVRVPGRRPGATPRTVKIHIPPGARTGDRLRLDDPPTTVVLSVDTGDFRLEGRDLYVTLPVTPWEAALGATLDMAAPRGTLRVRVPAGSSSGARLRLRHQGLPSKPDRGGPTGHMYVDVQIVLPSQLSEQERHLFEELSRLSDFAPRDD
ncbi:MAG: DnaJ C-terminal domain-containing protein [Myxococcota bacterium]